MARTCTVEQMSAQMTLSIGNAQLQEKIYFLLR